MANKRKTTNRPAKDPLGEGTPLPKSEELAYYKEVQQMAREIRAEESRTQQGKEKYKSTGVHTRLNQIREMQGKTQSEMAALFEISQPYYSTFEEGSRMLTAPMLMVLINEGYSSDYILAGKGTAHYSESKVNNTEFELLKKENDHLKSENDFLKKQVADFMEVLKRNK